ncbi:MAG: hypothetical protein BRD55_01110 [Bacteroidetes bacterium SW_9_63_38]|nr:MAG: hypothetical protein BRD55_01110 [Bacteroidetes bacterium SW_9_63_38]
MIERKVAILSHKYHVREKYGFKVKGGFQNLTNEIARHYCSVNLCVPVAEDGGGQGEAYRDNIEVTPLPAFQGRGELLNNLPEVASIMWGVIRESDIVYCMGPNDVGVLGMLLARLGGKRMFASLDTDRAGNVLRRSYSKLAKTVKYYINTHCLYPLIKFLCKDVPVFVTGDMFMRSYGPWTQWVKTTLQKDEMPPLNKKDVERGKEPFHVVFAGRLSPVKNLRRLIRAVDKLHTRDRSIRCTVIGSGKLRTELEQLANSLDASIEFPGQIQNRKLIESRFLGGDVLVLPSLEERQGKVLLEAMACSVPVVASDAGGIPSVIEDGVNGILCDPYSVEDIAQKISRVMQDPELRERLVQNGYEYATSHALDVEVDRLMNRVAKHYGLALS